MRAATRSGAAREGYVLIVVLAVIVTVMVTSLATLPATGVAADHERIDTAYDVLNGLTSDADQGIVRFVADVTKLPANLTQLRSQITGAQASLCGSAYTTNGRTPDVDDWGSPYIYRELVGGQLFAGIGWVQNAFVRDPASGTPTALIVRVLDVDERDARLLNTRVETVTESVPSGEGTIRWGAPDAEGRVELQWRRSVTSCTAL